MMIRYFRKVLKFLWLVALCIVLVTASSAVVSFFLSDKVYEGRISYYIYPEISEDVYKNMQAAEMIAADMSNILTSDYILDLAKADIPIYKSLSNKEISDSIDAMILNKTRVLQIKIKGSQPKEISLFLSSLTVQLENFSQNLYGQKTLELLGKPQVPISPVSPNHKRDIIIGVLAGFVLGLFVIFLIDSFQESISQEEVIKEKMRLKIGDLKTDT